MVAMVLAVPSSGPIPLQHRDAGRDRDGAALAVPSSGPIPLQPFSQANSMYSRISCSTL